MILGKQYSYLNKKDIKKLTCLFCFDETNLLSTAFSNLPMSIKQHNLRVGSISGLMAKFVPINQISYGMDQDEFTNAVRYGAQYHDIAAYLVYNIRQRYPSSGEKFLREQIDDDLMNLVTRRVILETVKFSGERYDGTGYPECLSGDKIPIHAELCAIADTVDDFMTTHHILWKKSIYKTQRYIIENKGIKFSPQAVDCFISSIAGITYLYKLWRRNPPVLINKEA